MALGQKPIISPILQVIFLPMTAVSRHVLDVSDTVLTVTCGGRPTHPQLSAMAVIHFRSVLASELQWSYARYAYVSYLSAGCMSMTEQSSYAARIVHALVLPKLSLIIKPLTRL